MAKVKKAKRSIGKKTASKKAAKKKPVTRKPNPGNKKGKKIALKKSSKKPTIKKKLKITKPQKSKKKTLTKANNNKQKKIVTKTSKPLPVKSKIKPVQNTSAKKPIKNNKSAIKLQPVLPPKKQKPEKGILLTANPKTKMDHEEKLHSKTQRIMKELEETMDMEKVKPRIKVPGYAPPKPRPAPVLKLVEPANTKKEKYQLEFEFRSSKSILFSYLCDSSGMAGWFADEVKSSDNNYTFVWEGSETHAKLVALKDQQLVRYEWTDENDGTYFQFEIKEDDITSDIALMITDWANPGEKESAGRLWESQVQNLRQLIGSV